jgi:hypothetical protein
MKRERDATVCSTFFVCGLLCENEGHIFQGLFILYTHHVYVYLDSSQNGENSMASSKSETVQFNDKLSISLKSSCPELSNDICRVGGQKRLSQVER